MTKAYMLFFTTSSAFRCEKIFKTMQLTSHFKLIPTPREYSSDCGIAMYLECEDIENVKKNTLGVEYELILLK